jgi:protein gp37
MSQLSGIEWTVKTWNPVRGCTRCSPGCLNCYAERDYAGKNENPRVPGCHGFAIFDERGWPRWTGRVELVPHKLDEPLREKTPTTYFVNSVSDLFHELLPFEDIYRVFETMRAANWHRFQILTKRPERLLAFTHWLKERGEEWPPQCWLGVSVEDRKRKARIGVLRAVEAHVRFLSLEPLLEDLGELDLAGIHWVIVGGESGPGGRPGALDPGPGARGGRGLLLQAGRLSPRLPA